MESTGVNAHVLLHGNPCPDRITGGERIIVLPLQTKGLETFGDLLPSLGTPHGHIMEMWLLSVAMVRYHQDLGTPACRYPVGHKKRHQFFEAVAMLIHYPGKASRKECAKVIKEGTAHGHRFDASFEDEVERARKRLEQRFQPKKKKTQTKLDAQERREEASAVDIDSSEEEDEDEEQPAIPRQGQEAGMFVMASVLEPDGHMDVYGVPAEQPAAGEEQGEQEEPLLQHAMPRVRMYLQALDEDATACLAIFAIFDPKWNPGEAIDEMIRHANDRAQYDADKMAQPGSRHFYKEFYNHLSVSQWRDKHPIFNINRIKYTKMIKNYTVDMEGMNLTTISNKMIERSILGYGSEFHPCSVYSLDAAKTYLALKMGLGDLSVNIAYDRHEKVLYLGGQDTSMCYLYEPEGIFWYDALHKYVSLPEQYLPWRALAQYKLQMDLLGKEADLEALAHNNDDVRIHKPQKENPFEQEDVIYNLQQQAKKLESAINSKYQEGDYNFEQASRQREKLRSLMLNRLSLIWKPYSNLLPGLAAITKWQAENVKTRFINPQPMIADFSIFGSAMILEAFQLYYNLELYGSCRLAVIVCYGALDCYVRERGLKLNTILFGPGESGKTYLLDLLINRCSIPGTVVSVSEKSAMADTSHNAPEMYCMVFQEEYEPYVVNAKAAKNKPNLVKRRKEMLTAQKSERGVLTVKDGSRIKQIVVTPHFNTECGACNDYVPAGDEALVSRYHCEMVTENLKSRLYSKVCVPTDQRGRIYKNNVLERMKGVKFMQAISHMAINVGALPAISVHLGNAIIDKMLDYLSVNGVSKVHQKRNTERLYRLAKQLCVKDAVLKVWGVPDAPHYGKDFNVSQLKELTPFLFLTLDHVLFAWTALHTEYIQESHGIVLRAIDKMTKGLFSSGKSGLQLLQENTVTPARFRRVRSTAAADDQLDMNYISINPQRQKLDAVVTNIMTYTDKRMNRDQVIGALEGLSGSKVKPRHGVLKFISEVDAGIVGKVANMTEASLKDNTTDELPLVYMDKHSNTICVLAGQQLDQDATVMEEAFWHMCIYKGLKPRKIVLGTNTKETNHLWKVLDITQEDIDLLSETYGREKLVVNAKKGYDKVSDDIDLVYSNINTRDRGAERTVISEDLDVWAAKQHWIECGMPCNDDGEPMTSYQIRAAGLARDRYDHVEEVTIPARILPVDLKGRPIGIDTIIKYQETARTANTKNTHFTRIHKRFSGDGANYPQHHIEQLREKAFADESQLNEARTRYAVAEDWLRRKRGLPSLDAQDNDNSSSPEPQRRRLSEDTADAIDNQHFDPFATGDHIVQDHPRATALSMMMMQEEDIEEEPVKQVRRKRCAPLSDADNKRPRRESERMPLIDGSALAFGDHQ